MEQLVSIEKDFYLSESDVNDLMGVVISTLNDVYGITILETKCDRCGYTLKFATKKEVTVDEIVNDILKPSFQTTFATSISEEDWEEIKNNYMIFHYYLFQTEVFRKHIRIKCNKRFELSSLISSTEEEEA